MGLARWVLLVLAVLIGYKMSQVPVPEGASQPIRLRILFTAYDIFLRTCWLLEKVGITSEATVKKYLVNKLSLVMKGHPSDVMVEDTVMAGVSVRVFTPRGRAGGSQGPRPGLVYYHGGGWTIGNLDSHHRLTALLAGIGNVVVVSVDYRLNPEFSVKDGFDDCVAVTKHFIQHAAEYSVDPERICVAGDSAGGNYAAAVSLYLRDTKFSPMPKLQMLIYPAVQTLDLQLPSFQQNRRGPVLDLRELMWFKSIIYNKNGDYVESFADNTHVPPDVREKMAKSLLNVELLPKEMLYPPYKPPTYTAENKEIWNKVKERAYDPYFYPLMADDHSNLPEAYIFTGQYDVLRDDGFLYARKLREAKVKVTHYNCPFGWHGMVNFVKDLEDSRRVATDMAEFLRDNL